MKKQKQATDTKAGRGPRDRRKGEMGTEGRWRPADLVSRPCRPGAGGVKERKVAGGGSRIGGMRRGTDPLVPDEGDSGAA